MNDEHILYIRSTKNSAKRQRNALPSQICQAVNHSNSNALYTPLSPYVVAKNDELAFPDFTACSRAHPGHINRDSREYTNSSNNGTNITYGWACHCNQNDIPNKRDGTSPDDKWTT